MEWRGGAGITGENVGTLCRVVRFDSWSFFFSFSFHLFPGSPRPRNRRGNAESRVENVASVLSQRDATHTRARSCRVALYFHFRCLPRGAVPPYIYLIAAPPDRGLFSYTDNRFTAAAYSSGCAHFAPPLYGQFPFPLCRVLEIIKSSLREDWLRCLNLVYATVQSPSLVLVASFLSLSLPFSLSLSLSPSLQTFPFRFSLFFSLRTVVRSYDVMKSMNRGPLFISCQIFLLFSFSVFRSSAWCTSCPHTFFRSS